MLTTILDMVIARRLDQLSTVCFGEIGTLLNQKVSCSLAEAKILIYQRRKEYNQVQSHGALGHRLPVTEATKPVIQT